MTVVMNCSIFKIFLLIVLNSLMAYSQTKFNIGVEGGLNSSGFPTWRSLNYGKESYFPLLSPIVGLSASHSVTKHIYTSIGIQYHRSGERFHSFREDFDYTNQTKVTISTWENTTYLRFSMPIVFGYNFRIKKKRMNTFMGYRIIYHSGGSYYKKTIIKEDGSPDLVIEKRLSPFDQINLITAAPKKIGLPIIGMGIAINEKWSAIFSFTIATRNTYFEEKRPFWDAYTGHNYYRSDLALLLRYHINK